MNGRQIGAGVVGAGLLFGGAYLVLNERSEPITAKGAAELLLPGEESLFAEIDPVTGEVLRVIVIDADLINSGRWGDPKNWVRTYAKAERGRKNAAGIGYTYREDLDAFVAPKPFESWELDESTAQWNAPVEEPKNGKAHEWDERTKRWVELNAPYEKTE